MSRRQRIVASSPCWEALTIHDGPIEYGDLTLPGCFCWRNTPCPWWQPMWHQNKRSNTLLLKHGFLLEGWFSRKDWWAHSYTQEDLSIDPLIRLKTTTRRINHTKSNTFHQGFVWVVIHVLLHQWLYIYIHNHIHIYIYIIISLYIPILGWLNPVKLSVWLLAPLVLVWSWQGTGCPPNVHCCWLICPYV